MYLVKGDEILQVCDRHRVETVTLANILSNIYK